jgi:hypothetical protein
VKKIFVLLFPVILFQSALIAQCGSGSCPSGSVNVLPANGTIDAGTTYCISGPVSNTTAYTINGTLIIQSGSVTLGNLNVSKTGSVIVNGGARLMANSYTGESTTAASLISNMTVCNNGYLYMSGAINPGETNFTVSDYGMFVIHGSWSTIMGDTYFKLGLGAIVEMCSSFTFISSTGFFTETSSGPSYVVTRSAMANGAGSGYLSKSGNASQIRWDISGGPVAWVTHPAAYTCTGTSCSPMLPTGSIDNGLCGSVVDSYQTAVTLPLQIIDVDEQLSGEQLLISALLGEALTTEHIVLESTDNGVSFIATGYIAVDDGSDGYRFTLPASASVNYYRVRVIRDGETVYSKVLPPLSKGWSSQVRVFPDPVTNFIFVATAANEKITSAVMINCMGQTVYTIPVSGVNTNPGVRYEFPASLPAGIYFIKLMEKDRAPLTFRILKSR